MVENLWMVSRGSYSDYRVVAAARSKEDAERIVDRLNKAEGLEQGDYYAYFVEELDLITPDDVRVMEHLSLECDIDLTTGEVLKEYPPYSLVEGRWSDEVEDRIIANFSPLRWYGVAGKEAGRLSVSGWDPERVRKVYGDHKAALMADQAIRDGGWRKL